MPGINIVKFRLFDIDVCVHWSWILIFVLFSWSWSSYLKRFILKAGPEVYSNPELISWILSASLAILIFASVLAHELGHSLVARRLGFSVEKITLFALGGASHINMEDVSKNFPSKNFYISAIGPLVSLLLAAGLWFLSYIIGGNETGAFYLFLFLLLSQLALLNFLLAVFNSLPVYPLDGGRVLLSVFRFAGRDYESAYRAVNMVGIAGSILLVSGAFFLGSFWLVLIGGFLLVVNFSERRSLKK